MERHKTLLWAKGKNLKCFILKVRREHPEEFRAKVRKGATTRQTSPVKALSEFQQRFHDLSTSSSVSSVNSQTQLELDPVNINK